METFSLVKTKRNQFHPTLGTPAAMGDHFSQALAAMYQAKVGIVGCRRLLRAPDTTCIVLDFRWPLVLGRGSGPSNAEGGGRGCLRRETGCCGCSRRQAFLRIYPFLYRF